MNGGNNTIHQSFALQSLDQSITWATKHGDTRGLIHHSDHGIQYTSSLYSTHVSQVGMRASRGTVGDPYDKAMAETVNCAYKTELIRPRKPFTSVAELEEALFQGVSGGIIIASTPPPSYKSPAKVKTSIAKATGVKFSRIQHKSKPEHIRQIC